MSDIVPYIISVPQSEIDLLHHKLALATFPSEVEDVGWNRGAPLADIKRLSKAWETFDWRAYEAHLNQLPQYHTPISIDGFGDVDIHFVHKPSQVGKAIPLLFVHGWPGHYTEVLKILDDLATPPASSDAPAFTIVAPSLPNFGFSAGVKKCGFAIAQYAETCHKLMLKLGYDKYVTQAGDWGFWITRAIGKLYPTSCKASHINMVFAREPSKEKFPQLVEKIQKDGYDEYDKRAMKRRDWFQEEGTGYNKLQSTKPQTISYALQDSPVALLAWIYEKLHDWTDAYPWADEEVLQWVSIYQFSRAGAGAAGMIYYECTHTDTDETGPGKGMTYDRLIDYTHHVKFGLAHNPMDLDTVPKVWSQTLGEIVYEAENGYGGHFYAHEHPELLVRDMRTMFGRQGGAYEVVEGKGGY